MSGLPPLLRKLLVLLLFLVLQAGAVVLLIHNSYFQQNVILKEVRSWQTRWWERRSSWTAFTTLKTVNEELALENNRLLEELARLSALENELNALMEKTEDSSGRFTFIPARVIRNSVTRQHNHIVIDKGSSDGIQPDMGVISAGGIVGVVANVSEHYALIISLLNTDQRFTGELKKTGSFGTLRWDGVNYRRVLLSEIPQHIEVTPGDTVISSHFSLIFPPGIPIGSVQSGSLKRGTFLELEVELFSDFKTLRYVNVVSHDGIREYQGLIETEPEESP